MKHLIKSVIILCLIAMTVACTNKSGKTHFAKIENNHFVIDGNSYYFIGTNFWYGAILGSQGEGGDRERLIRELDFMKSNGIDNLRVLIGADGPNGVPTKVEPTLQVEQGVYNDDIFDGLDFLLAEMNKRGMYAVLYFTNSWEWSGGYSQYLNWAGYGKVPVPAVDGWDTYMNFVKQYAGCEECREMLKQHISTVVSRTNRYNGVKYTDDPTIFSWQIGNEPRAFSDENKPLFAAWLKEISAHIKSLDSNHMVSVGSEGKHGCEGDIALFEEIHSDPNIDYLTMHIWPKNWGWLDTEDMAGTLQLSIENTMEYMAEHIAIAEKLQKPVVLSEFGFPRDGHEYSLSAGTSLRDAYYEAVFKAILQSSENKSVLAGCNLWAWGGFGRPAHIFWQKGDDYVGDPAQEEQGLNAVFDTDETVKLIKKYVSQLESKPLIVDMNATQATFDLYDKMQRLMNKGVMLGHQDDTAYGYGWYGEKDRSDVKETTGDYPAVIGWEIADVELGHEFNIDSIRFSDMKRLMREQHERGGINSISWHANNIVTGSNAWDCEQDYVVKSVLPGGEKHQDYLNWLDKVGDFFLDLKDANGELIPVIFRMYHEHTGSWFWWGAAQSTPEEYNELFRMTVRRLRDTKNVHNILYAFSTASIATEEEFLLRYPGDEWVDIIGFDTYAHESDIALYQKDMKNGLEIVTNYAKQTGKIPVVAETGLECIKIDDYFTRIVLPLIEPYKISYILFWRNAINRPEHYYVPYLGHPAANDFKVFAENELILMAKDLAADKK